MGLPAESIPLAGGIDERNQQRWLLVNNLRVLNAEDDQLLGHIVNVTTEGIMIISEQALPIETDFHIKMEIPAETENTTAVDLKARSIWTKPDSDPFFHCTGMQLVHCSEESMQVISKMIKQLQQLQTSDAPQPD